MGPTNVALVRLFQADQALREAQEHLDAESASVRGQERRITDLAERVKLTQLKLRETQSKSGQLELDIKTRDARIEKLRAQQQESKNHKEYQVFLAEIATEKLDKNKTENETLKVMEEVEGVQRELDDLNAQLDAERQKHKATVEKLAGRLAELQAEVDRLRPDRDEAAAAAPPKVRDLYDRLADRYEGDPVAAVTKPDRRREEYACGACNMDLVVDVYNKLHSRDDLVYCPNCQRMLYIPDDLPPETAIHKKDRKEMRGDKDAAVPSSRQLSAADVSRSIAVEEDEPTETPPTD